MGQVIDGIPEELQAPARGGGRSKYDDIVAELSQLDAGQAYVEDGFESEDAAEKFRRGVGARLSRFRKENGSGPDVRSWTVGTTAVFHVRGVKEYKPRG